ncbi:YbaB/EbfC family nucleoid-associated protein [Streptomyces albus]|nr:YbaB/EbfC family nucleoid-associated protein [Streptomyces albus]
MSQLREQRERLLDAQRALAKKTVSVTSKNRMVTVVVGAQSEVRDITFHTEAYRTMAPAELGRTLVEALEEARKKARAEVFSTLSPMTGFGERLRASMLGGTEIGKVVEQLHAAAEEKAGPESTRWPRDPEDETND